jgi:transposase
MKKTLADAPVIRRKMFIVQYNRDTRNILKACKEFGVPRSSYYRWKKAVEKEGIEGLIRKKPVAKSHPRKLPPEVIENILHLRRTYHLGPQRITWYLER